MHFGSSKLAGTRLDDKNRLSSCVKLLLLWVAASDGEVDAAEREFAATQFPEGAGTVPTDDLLSAIRDNDVTSLETALRTLAHESRELRTAFLDLAVTMSMADQELAIPENHILRFYADALHIGLPVLERRFQAICGKALAEPGDPSSLEWWERFGVRIRQPRAVEPVVGDKPQPPAPTAAPPRSGMTRERARAVLGVGPDASGEQIERAYRSLNEIFQVHRVEAMGEAAVAVARDRADKIQEAYSLLRE